MPAIGLHRRAGDPRYAVDEHRDVTHLVRSARELLDRVERPRRCL
jgi:hypothetical protein